MAKTGNLQLFSLKRVSDEDDPNIERIKKIAPKALGSLIRSRGKGNTIKASDIHKHTKIPTTAELLHELDKREKPEVTDPFDFQHPWRGHIVGSSGSGKTRWLAKYLLQHVFDCIIWCTPKISASQTDLKVLKKKYGQYLIIVECEDGIDAKAITDHAAHGKKKKWKQIVVFDDLVHRSTDRFIQRAFTSFRHYGCSVVELMQSIFPDGARIHRINCDVFVIFRFAIQDETHRLFMQLFGKEKAEQLTEIYKQIIAKKHNCMIVDLRAPIVEGQKLTFRDTELNRIIPVKD